MSPDEARRAVLAAQGFATVTPTDAPDAASRRALVATVRRVGLLQIDSVNVLTRAHYLPLFSRLGRYDVADLDAAAARRPRALFEYWGHEASLLPVSTQPLLRWRMAGEHPWGGVRRAMRDRADLIDPVLHAVAEMGPTTITHLERHLEHDEPRPTGEWGWNWSVVKQLVEGLFWNGTLSSAGRDRGFRRRYDLTERVLPAAVLAAPTPQPAEAVSGLIAIAARALGVATLADLRDYFRLPAASVPAAIAALVTAGELEPVAVPGWPPAWRHRAARVPRSVDARALLVPFDPLIWHRERVERVFGMRYRIEIYTPAPDRRYGYYVLPFLQGDRLSGRVDLRADRRQGRLVVAGAWDARAETGKAAEPAALAASLRQLGSWLDVPDVVVLPNGDLSADLASALAAADARP